MQGPQSKDAQSVMPGPTTSAASGILREMQILCPTQAHCIRNSGDEAQ